MKAVLLIVISLLYFTSTMNAEESKKEKSSYAFVGINYLFPNDADASFLGFDLGLRKTIDEYHIGFESSGFYGISEADGLQFLSIRPSIGINVFSTKDNKFKILMSTSSGLVAGSKDKVNFYGTLSTADIELTYDIFSLMFRGNYLVSSVMTDAFGSVGFRIYIK